MPLREEMEKQGNWLFRRRSFLPLLMAPLLVSAFWRFNYLGDSHNIDMIWEMLCLAISILGVLIRAYAVGCVASATSGRRTGRGQKAASLNTTGMYSLMRHPLYFANFFVGLGPVMFFHDNWLNVVYALVFFFYYERIIFAEEEFLREKFGGEYAEWAGRTPMLAPRFKNWRPPGVKFSYRTALKREYQTIFLVVLIFFAFELVGDSIVERRLVLDRTWGCLFGASLLFFVVVRIIRKKTNLLRRK